MTILRRLHAVALPLWWIAALALVTEASYLCYGHRQRLYWVLLGAAVIGPGLGISSFAVTTNTKAACARGSACQ